MQPNILFIKANILFVVASVVLAVLLAKQSDAQNESIARGPMSSSARPEFILKCIVQNKNTVNLIVKKRFTFIIFVCLIQIDSIKRLCKMPRDQSMKKYYFWICESGGVNVLSVAISMDSESLPGITSIESNSAESPSSCHSENKQNIYTHLNSLNEKMNAFSIPFGRWGHTISSSEGPIAAIAEIKM